MGLIPLADAQAHVLAAIAPLAPQPTPLSAAAGLVVATDVTATHPVPPFDNTAMDGYAVRAADTAAAPVELEVAGTAAAGPASGLEVGPGRAVRIMTGAPLPTGADAVVIVEWTKPVHRASGDTAGDAGGERVLVERSVAVGDHIRRTGEDVTTGDVVAHSGDRLTPARIGGLANVGAATVNVHPRPRVGVVSTGDELVPVEFAEELGPGLIRDSNRPMLLALVVAAGFDAVDLGHRPDDRHVIAAAFTSGAAGCDAVLSSGGVSVGDFDLVKAVLDDLGEMSWMQIAIKPAKPFAFGVVGGRPVFGLPGNPVSAAVSFELLALPALRRMAGHRDDELVATPLRCRAAEPLSRHADGKTHYVRVSITAGDDGWECRQAGGQGSHQLSALAAADGLAVLADGPGVAAGDHVAVLPLTGAPSMSGPAPK
ncbi:MAG TPA: gephyrin-like molybdotransferase Glp [Acidimicrobiales bacterium]